MTLNETRTMPIHAKIIAFNQTADWCLEECPFNEHIERIEGVYVYDANEYTYYCSTSPSYWMRFIEDRAIFKEGVYDFPDFDTIADAIDNFILSRDHSDDDCYMSVSEVDAAFDEKVLKKFEAKDLGITDYLAHGGEYEETMDAIIEGVRCNAKI